MEVLTLSYLDQCAVLELPGLPLAEYPAGYAGIFMEGWNASGDDTPHSAAPHHPKIFENRAAGTDFAGGVSTLSLTRPSVAGVMRWSSKM
jgi:hypothetical protein